MGIFGKLDIDDVPDDPFAVGEGTYSGHVSKVNLTKVNDDVDKFVINYEVEEPEDSEYVGNSIGEWFTYYPELEESDLAEMEPKDRQQVLRDMAQLKRRLTHLGVTEEQMDELETKELAELITGTMVDFAVVKKPDREDPDKFYHNIKYVRMQEDD